MMSTPTAPQAAPQGSPQIFGPGDHVVVVVAHPDDETFGCGSLIALASERGAKVSVVCATRGEAGEATAAVDLTRQSLGEVRETELREAARLLGATHVELLDLVDSGFDGPFQPGTLCAADSEALTRRLVDTFARLQPTVVLTLDGCDGHRDHVVVRDAVVGAVQGTPIRLYQTTIPNSYMRRWLDERLASGESTVYHDIDPSSFGRPDAEISIRLDVAHLLPTRVAAIALHRSQRSPFDDLSTELRELFLSTDHLVTLEPHRQ
jgi:LmbE family N-acetylglucosaminyl deacetylase